jgi:hypothetical protein
VAGGGGGGLFVQVHARSDEREVEKLVHGGPIVGLRLEHQSHHLGRSSPPGQVNLQTGQVNSPSLDISPTGQVNSFSRVNSPTEQVNPQVSSPTGQVSVMQRVRVQKNALCFPSRER